MRDNKSVNMDEITYINGPINLVRLEGYVAKNKKKVLYLFLDFHLSVDTQTQCTNLFSLDINKYLIQKMKSLNNSKKKYDFFIEIVPSDIVIDSEKIADKKQRYVDEVMKDAIKIFTYDKEKDLVYTNNIFKNVRIHYLDIRIFFGDDLDMMIKNILDNLVDGNIIDKIPYILNDLSNVEKIVDDYIILLKGKYTDVQKDDSVVNPRNKNLITSKYLINKITTKYKYPENKTKINEMLMQQIDEFVKYRNIIKKTIEKINRYMRFSKKYNELGVDTNDIHKFGYGMHPTTTRIIETDIINMMEYLDDLSIERFARFTDLYFLRRFIDKDYITNAIVYSGALHSITYIDFLVKKLNFKVTHANYHKYSMDDTNKIIKKISLYDIQELFYPPVFSQCINVEKFPKNFE